VIFPGSSNLDIVFNLNGYILKSSNSVKLLGIEIDNKLSFFPHVRGLTFISLLPSDLDVLWQAS